MKKIMIAVLAVVTLLGATSAPRRWSRTSVTSNEGSWR